MNAFHPAWERRARPALRRGGFTLIEVLATILLMAIALPAIMNGISMASRVASDAHRRIDATALGESKLAQIVADNEWELAPTTSGNFGSDWPAYQWDMTLSSWAQDTTGDMQQIDLRVLWKAHGQQQSMTFSTIVYQRAQQQ